MIVLDESNSADLLRLPESGMGFQLVEFWTDDAKWHRGVAFNAEWLFEPNDPPSRVAELSFKELDRLRSTRSARSRVREIRLQACTDEREFRGELHEAHVPSFFYRGPANEAPPEPSFLGETFMRYCAFAQDRRINADGSLTPGTYATTLLDSFHVQTGQQAVERYALPNPTPAVHRFTLTPPKIVQVQRGIAQPNFGQPGGGAEVIFTLGAPARTKVRMDVIPDR